MDIEGSSVGYLNEFLGSFDFVQSHIATKDKEPSFDGDVYFNPDIKDGEHFHSDGMHRIPVQVKGTRDRKYASAKIIKYKIDKKDLENYRRACGVLFFVVFCDPEERKNKIIYYVSLLPLKIDKYLKHSNQQSYSVKLQRLEENKRSLFHVLSEFVDNRNRQGVINSPGFDCSAITSERLGNLKFHLRGLPLNFSVLDLAEKISKEGIYLYAQNQEDIELPYKYIDPEDDRLALHFTKNNTISTIDGVFYETSELIYDAAKGKPYVGFGSSFKLSGDDFKLHFNLKGSLKERIRDLNFLISLTKHHQVMLDNYPIEVGSANINIEDLERGLEEYNSMLKVLDALNIKQDLDMDSSSSDDMTNLWILKKAVLDKENVVGIKIKEQFEWGFLNFNIANLYVVMLARLNTDGSYTLIDFNTCSFKEALEENEIGENLNVYFWLSEDQLIKASNLNWDVFRKQASRCGKSESVLARANNLALNLIKAYDETGNVDYINNALYQFDILLSVNSDCKDLYKINKFQSLKRLDKIKTKESREIVSILSNAEKLGNLSLQFACYVILGDLEESNNYYSMLTSEEKEVLIPTPIMTLFRQLKQKHSVNDNS